MQATLRENGYMQCVVHSEKEEECNDIFKFTLKYGNINLNIFSEDYKSTADSFQVIKQSYIK